MLRVSASRCRSTDGYGLARVILSRQNKQDDGEHGDDFRRAVAVDHVTRIDEPLLELTYGARQRRTPGRPRVS